MTMEHTAWLALTMGLIALVNTALMAWLWRFPMVPDPSGRDPNGVSTAPRWGTNIHRLLGYLFTAAYALLLVEMIPRAWQYRTGTPLSVVHGALGFFIGVVLIFKIVVIRRYQRFGNRLPWIGGALAALTLIVSTLGVIPAWMVLQPFTTLTPELAAGRRVVSAKCNQCHGASTIAGESEDAREWDHITREMQELSREIPGKSEITEDERILATAYLAHVLGEGDDEDHDDEEKDGRRRGRGRGRGNTEGPASAGPSGAAHT
jgi:hypothetical protein